MQAMILTAPPQARQVSMSMPNTRFRRCAHVFALSIIPIYVIVVFAFCFFVPFRAQRNRSINTQETFGVYGFLGAFGLWNLISIIMGIKKHNVALMDPLLQKPDLSRTGSFEPIPRLL